MPQIGPAEILVILLVGLLVFGPKRLPEIGRQVGRAMREVRKFQDTVKGELDGVLHLADDETTPTVDDQAAIAAAEAPAALLPETEPGLPDTAQLPSHAPSRFRTPPPPAERPWVSTSSTPTGPTPAEAFGSGTPDQSPSRAPSRFRAPGPRPTA
jgi:sec-independent protein translocase protein TatA